MFQSITCKLHVSLYRSGLVAPLLNNLSNSMATAPIGERKQQRPISSNCCTGFTGSELFKNPPNNFRSDHSLIFRLHGHQGSCGLPRGSFVARQE